MIDADDLPEGWVLATLGDVSAPKVKQGEPRPDADFTYIDIGSVDNQSKRITDPKVTPGAKAPSRARQLVEPGDVLVSMTRPNLNAVATVPPELAGSVASTGFHVLRPTGVVSEWLFAVVRSTAFVQAMSELVQGALYPAVRPDDIRGFTFPLPPLAEQRRIIARIEALQVRSRTAREALEAVPGLLEQLRQSVLAAAFRGDLTADWREQHPDTEPAEALLDRIRHERRRQWALMYPGKRYVEPGSIDDRRLPDLPDGWCWASMDELAEVQLGQRRAPEYLSSTAYPYIRSANITWDGLDLTDVKTMGFADPEPLMLRKGDILLNEASGSPTEVGKPGLWNDEIPGCCFQATVVRLRLYSTEINPQWLYFACLRDAILAEYAARCPGIGILHLTAKLLRTWPVPVAPLAEQEALLGVLPNLLGRVKASANRLAELRQDVDTLNQTVLAKAFSGELVPQDPADEPASALLERIRTGGRPPSAPSTPLRVEEVVHDLILLLEAVGGAMDRAALELGLVLMRNDRARTAILDKTARLPRGPAAGRTHVAGLDHLLGDLQRLKGWVTITAGSPQTVALTDRAPATDGATADDRRRVQETLKVMATVKKDRLAAAVEKVSDVAYELVPGR